MRLPLERGAFIVCSEKAHKSPQSARRNGEFSSSEHEKEVELVIQRPLRGFDGRAELSRKRAKRTSQLPP